MDNVTYGDVNTGELYIMGEETIEYVGPSDSPISPMKRFPGIKKFCDFPGEEVESMAVVEEWLIVKTDKGNYIVDGEGNKLLIEDN